jgi:hypothetical protein
MRQMRPANERLRNTANGPVTARKAQRQLTDYRETWVDNVRQVHALLAETEIIRYTTTDGRTAWADTIILHP